MTVDDFLPFGDRARDPDGPADPIRALSSGLWCNLVWTVEHAMSVNAHRVRDEPDGEEREFGHLPSATDDALQTLARLIELLALGHTVDWRKPSPRGSTRPYFPNRSTVAPGTLRDLGEHPLDPPNTSDPLSILLTGGKRELVRLADYTGEYRRARRTSPSEADALAHRMSDTAQRASAFLARAIELLLLDHGLVPPATDAALAELRTFKQPGTSDWATATHPTEMCRVLRPLDYGVTVRFDPRKWRRFALACVRRVQHAFADPHTHALIDAVEEEINGSISAEELQALWMSGRESTTDSAHGDTQPDTPEHTSQHAFQALAWSRRCEDAGTATLVASQAREAALDPQAEGQAQASLLREVFGNPFTVTLPAAEWLAWNNGTVPALAEGIEKDNAFDRMPILGDALEDAGCTDAAILAHCREPHHHVRGCWVVDLLLGRHLLPRPK